MLIDYQKCVMYKIVCKNLKVIDLFVGFTTEDFNKMIQRHKSRCNTNDLRHNTKLYRIIKLHGGFDNWNVIEIEKFPCNNMKEANERRDYWIEPLKATLNPLTKEAKKQKLIEFYKHFNEKFDEKRRRKKENDKKQYQKKKEAKLNIPQINVM